MSRKKILLPINKRLARRQALALARRRSAPPFGAMTIETAYQHHGIQARYLNCELAPDALGDVVRAARAMGWAGF